MTQQSTFNEGPLTFLAGEALAAYRRVKIKSGTVTSPPEVEYADAGEACIGVTMRSAALGATVLVWGIGDGGKMLVCASKAVSQGAILYGANDGKVSDAASGTAQFTALMAASGNGHIIPVIVNPFVSTTAGTVSIADTGGFTAAATVEAALAEIYQALKTAQYAIFPALIAKEDGTVLTKFADGAGGVGWAQLSNKELALRWNDNAAPDKIALQFPMPQDINDAAAVVLHLMGAIVKAGESEADSPTFTVEAYFSEVGAAPASDTDCGGVSGEFLTAAGDEFQEKTLSIAHGDVPASPSVLTLIINPTDGQLGTDDFILLTPWLEVTRTLQAA